MELREDARHMLIVARRLFGGRDGRTRLALVLALTATVEAILNRGSNESAAAVIPNIVAVAPILVAFRLPFLGAASSTLATLAVLASPEAPITLTALGVLTYTIGSLVVRRGLAFAVPLFVPFVVNAANPIEGDAPGVLSVGLLLLVVATSLVAESTRKQGEAVAALDATQEAMAESARDQTAMEERARIARELHDIVAHHLSVIAIQSETARLTSPRLSKDARGRFEAIGATARDALTETRRLLGVLREDVEGDAERAPQPSLAQLTELVDTARDTGTNVRLVLQGTVVPLSPGVDLAAYRVLQEALTNARRHAPGAEVEVEVSYGADALHLRVRDHGPGAADADITPGHGLVGMRDRATIAGGSFSCGPAEGGGFVVDAVLPTGAAPA